MFVQNPNFIVPTAPPGTSDKQAASTEFVMQNGGGVTPAGTLSVVSYGGADPTGAADATSAFQQTVNQMAALGGGTVVIPPGTFSISGTVTFPPLVSLRGAGVVTAIVGTGASGQILFSIGDGTAAPKNLTYEGFFISFSHPQSAGAGILVRNCHDIFLRNIVIFSSNTYAAIQLNSGPQQYGYHLDGIEIGNGAYGIIIGGDPSGIVQEVWINDCIIAGQTQASISVRNGSGIYGKHISTLQGNRGIELIPVTGAVAKGINFDCLILDTCVAAGMLVNPVGSGQVYDNQFTSLWCASTSAGPGILIEGPNQISNMIFTGAVISNNNQQGVYLKTGVEVSFINCHVTDNSQAGSALFPGYQIAPGISFWSIIGGVAGSSFVFGGNNQSYGVQIDAGGSTHFSVIGVDLSTNVTGTLLNNAAGIEYIIMSPGTPAVISSEHASEEATFKIAAINNTGAGVGFQMFGDGATTPAKTLRVHGGNFQIVNNAYNAALMDLTDAGVMTLIAPLILPAYTVATLPAGTLGARATVSDATAPAFLGALTGGGTVKTPVFHNGTAWVAG
jgi:Pectate lyase superfamily protein